MSKNLVLWSTHNAVSLGTISTPWQVFVILEGINGRRGLSCIYVHEIAWDVNQKKKRSIQARTLGRSKNHLPRLLRSEDLNNRNGRNLLSFHKRKIASSSGRNMKTPSRSDQTSLFPPCFAKSELLALGKTSSYDQLGLQALEASALRGRGFCSIHDFTHSL